MYDTESKMSFNIKNKQDQQRGCGTREIDASITLSPQLNIYTNDITHRVQKGLLFSSSIYAL